MELSEIALQKLLQLFPEISGYIISFKDITEESGKEESGIQVGIFILQFGEEYYYIPVLAKNGTVLPIDSIFSASQQTFMPMTKSFLEKAMASAQVYLGKRTKIPGTVNKNPSVYSLVTPPRTGKFVYASSSRLVEFLATMPNMVKSAMVEKFSADKDVYNTLHRLFGLENILAALKPTEEPIKAVKKPAVELIRSGTGLDNSTVKSILEKGYALRGENTTERVAVLANDYSLLGPLTTIGNADVGFDYEIVTRTGEVLSAYVPKKALAAPQAAALLRPSSYITGSSSPIFALFSNGDYSISGNMISRGEGSNQNKVMQDLFGYSHPTTLKTVSGGDKIALFTPDLHLIGAYRVRLMSETSSGITVTCASLLPGSHSNNVTINAYRNVTNVDATDQANIFVPVNTLVVQLQKDCSEQLEVNINAALARFELNTLTAIGSAVDIGFDGIEFTMNGRVMGPEVNLVEALVIKEGISPDKAESFIKQAKERRHVKVYLSKVADFEPGEIPQYGQTPLEAKQNFGADRNGAFAGNLKASTETQDPQVVESMIISELLQASDMKSLVNEYLPEINSAIDKLGRTLFLARLNMDKLSGSQNASEIMSFIANLRNVYRLLGDNVTKLERMVSGPEEAQEEAGEKR